jgi:hypothetical protein
LEIYRLELYDYFYASWNNIEWQHKTEGICNEGRARDLMKVLSRLFLGGTEYNDENRQPAQAGIPLKI